MAEILSVSLRGNRAWRRDVHRLCGHVRAGRSRHQLRDELYPRLFGLSGEMCARSAGAAQRGILSRDHGHGARTLDPQPRLSSAVQRAPAHRAFAGGRNLPGARRGPARTDHRRMWRSADDARAGQRHAAERRPVFPGAVRQRRNGRGTRIAMGFPPPPSRPMSAPAASRPTRASAPLFVWKKRLRTDSGGPGRFRGGLGQEIEIELRTDSPARLSLLSDRHQHPASGILGGLPGAPSVIALDDGTKPEPEIPQHHPARSAPAPALCWRRWLRRSETARRATRCRTTLRDGYISAEAAQRDYGFE